MRIGRELIYVLTHGYLISPPSYELLLRVIGQGCVGILSVPVIIMIGIVIIAGLFLGKTTLGRYIYAVGGNEEAARLAGVYGWARPIAIVRAG